MSTVFIVATADNTAPPPSQNPVLALIIAGAVAVATGVFLLSALHDFPAWGDPQSPVNSTVAPYYIENTIRDAHVPNIRHSARRLSGLRHAAGDRGGFHRVHRDLFHSAAGWCQTTVDEPDIIAAPPARDLTDSLIIRQASRIMARRRKFAPYVIAHGHYSPGGGFQGGVILGARPSCFTFV